MFLVATRDPFNVRRKQGQRGFIAHLPQGAKLKRILFTPGIIGVSGSQGEFFQRLPVGLHSTGQGERRPYGRWVSSPVKAGNREGWMFTSRPAQ